jgi:hypothetical protein
MKKAVKTKKKSEKRDQYTVVLEDIRDNFRAFGENLGFVRDKVEKIEKTVNSHTEMIGRIMIDVEEIKSGMREKVDRREFVKLERRMVMLEAVVFGGKKR